MDTPPLALTISFWLHMLATVTWVGGLATLALVVFPVARRSLDAAAFAKLLRSINKRLDPIGWFGLTVLTVTGLIQMSANPNYAGFLSIDSPWARALLFKHIAFIAILAISAYQTWSLAPDLERAAFKRSRGLEANKETRLQRREQRLLLFNLIFGLIVLLFTAMARIA